MFWHSISTWSHVGRPPRHQLSTFPIWTPSFSLRSINYFIVCVVRATQRATCFIAFINCGKEATFTVRGNYIDMQLMLQLICSHKSVTRPRNSWHIWPYFTCVSRHLRNINENIAHRAKALESNHKGREGEIYGPCQKNCTISHDRPSLFLHLLTFGSFQIRPLLIWTHWTITCDFLSIISTHARILEWASREKECLQRAIRWGWVLFPEPFLNSHGNYARRVEPRWLSLHREN